MLTIPTAELCGLLTDTIPFAFPADELPSINVVRLEWDGARLTATATDKVRAVISAWSPDDNPLGEPAEDDLFAEWGSDDPGERWALSLLLADAAELVKVFRLPAKQGRTPLTVDALPTMGRVAVGRSRDTGHSELSATYDCGSEPFPDVRKMLAAASELSSVDGIAYTARQVADFAKVRAFGPMELDFTGRHKITHVRIGSRFVGAISPVRMDDERAP